MEIRWVSFQNYTIFQDDCNQEETDNLNRSINSSNTEFVIKTILEGVARAYNFENDKKILKQIKQS